MQKKPRKTEEKQKELVAKLKPIDDVFFEKLMEDPDACEEILQVILNNPRLRIKKDTVTGQKSIRVVGKRSIRLDAYAEGFEDKVFNIEIQKADNDNHVKRVRYNASVITIDRSEPGDRFEHVQELYVIYISQFDVLGNNLTISHCEMTCNETGEPVNDGLHEIYVNTTVKDGSKISRLMEFFLQTSPSNPEFPKISNRAHEIKNNPEEVNSMCELIEQYAQERANEAAIEAAIEATIETLRELDRPENEIRNKIMIKYNLEEADAQEYLSHKVLKH